MGGRGVVGGRDVVGGRGAWRVGGYVADELIGYGASAQVWRGHVGRTAEPVALKVLDLADETAVRAARAEAALLSALDHPHLVRLRELVPDGQSVVLVLELAAGGSLAQLLERRGRLSPGEVVTALSPIAAALAYAHDEGVVHSDVSPANVLFRANGSSLLADLGVARIVGGFDPPRSTLAYVDPGVAAGAVPSEASDVFMVAATALHALSGSPPWSGDTVAAMLDHAVTGEIDGLDARLSALPAALADVLRRGLDPSPVMRGSAAEFALDLRHAAPPIPVDLGAGPAPRPVRPPAGPVAAKTNAASARAELRSQLTSTARRRDDCAAGVYAPVPQPGAAAEVRGRRASKSSSRASRWLAGRAVADRAAAGRVHMPRHAVGIRVDAGSSSSLSPYSVSRPPVGPPDVALERPDFARPDDDRVGSFARNAAAGSGTPAPRPASVPSGAVPAPAGSVGVASGAWESASPDVPLALTHIVRSRIRPVAPPPKRRWRIGRPDRFPHALLAVVVVALLVGATAAWLRWEPGWPPRRPSASSTPVAPGRPAPTVRGSTAPARPSPSPSPSLSPSSGQTSAGRSGSPRTSAPPRAGPTTSATAWPTTDAGWTAVLTKLDLARQRAFASGDPAPLSAVYSDGSLLRQDRATLRQVVTPGCQLIGLRTVYRDVHASSLTARHIVLSTRASLTPARLICPRRSPQDMAARAPVAMTVVLQRVGGQFLIAAIRVPP